MDPVEMFYDGVTFSPYFRIVYKYYGAPLAHLKGRPSEDPKEKRCRLDNLSLFEEYHFDIPCDYLIQNATRVM